MSGTKVAMPQPNSFQSGALSFMSCTSGRESSPLDENDSHQTAEFKTETKKKRFHPLRNLRRMFRRKTRRSSISTESYQSAAVENPEITPTTLEQRSCSTSRLQEENLTQDLFRNSRLNPGLSLSHDSIFTPDRADSGLSSSDLENSSLSITVLTPPSKECPMKSQSSCSETSLLSIGSSEVELSPVRSGGRISELDVGTTAYKLSHSAARHKMAVKPRRNHGAPRSRRKAMATKSSLPMTPEVSEEGTTGRNSPPLESPPLDSPGNPPKCDKQDAKISWSDVAMDSVTKEHEDKGSTRAEDEADAKEEEATTQRSESFFGRFLSRRSDKKKLHQESSPDESGEEKSNFVKKFSKNAEGKGMTRKIPNRRQRVEPVEIPSTCSSKCDFGKEKEEQLGRKLSGSVSPPKSYWPSQITSHSVSPPKVVWPENATPHVRADGATSTASDKPRANASPTSQPTENVLKDWKNPNFVKELTVSVSSFAREKSGKREKEDEEETAWKIRRQHSEDATPRKPCNSIENVVVGKIVSNSPESGDSPKSSGEESVAAGAPPPLPLCITTINPFSFEAIHDGYENIKIIEQVKEEVRKEREEVRKEKEEVRKEKEEVRKEKDEVRKEKEEVRKEKEEGQPVVGETRREPTPESEKKIKLEVSFAKTDGEKQNAENETEVVKRVKPAVSEKPKELKRAGMVGGESVRVNASRREGKSPEEGQTKVEKSLPTKATLVERRKSELLLLTETEEKELKGRVKPLKKQTSFSETSAERGAGESTEKGCTSPEREGSAEKTESATEVVEVVMRKKSVVKASDEQPELMKVFARRSLKVREGEKLGEELQRSRDSDKENEVVESPREERKKGGSLEREKEEEKGFAKEGGKAVGREKGSEVKVVSVTPLKPEVAFRKSVLQRYGRSLSENNGKGKEEKEQKRESVVLEESKLNKMKRPEKVISVKLEREEEGGQEEEEEGMEVGFKRIQQRKAEWERRAQQGAK